MFTDVEKDAWYRDAVKWAYDKGIMNGISDNTFEPETDVTRAMVVAMLHRMAGEPEGGAANSFADTDANALYSQAVRWATAEGVIYGYGDTEFGPVTMPRAYRLLLCLCGSPLRLRSEF